LLLTFFFRHMQELIRGGRVYVAQPPLYQVTRRKKSEYVLNERRMRQTLTELGLENTELVIRDPENPTVEIRRLKDDELRRVIELLTRLEELVRVVQRRGIDFADFLGKRDSAGRLPLYRAIVEGEDRFFHSADERDAFLRQSNLVVEEDETAEIAAPSDAAIGAAHADSNGNGSAKGAEHLRRLQKNQELHEVKEMEKLFSQLEGYGLLIDDYFLTQEESVSGEKLATKYVLINESQTHNVAGVAQVLPEIHRIGKSGMEVKRFKGLGEMNSGQLWETTLDPSVRVLLRVTMNEAAEAERMFSVLMGEDVERRRQFIEEHALEVKNLDV
jgi:DNA gyrase subunit B